MRQEPYPPEFRQQVVSEYLAGASRKSLKRKYGLHQDTINAWIHKLSPPEKSGRVVEPPSPSPSLIDEVNIHGDIVLAIPDMHHPFCHPHALLFLQAIKAKYKPTKVVCLGDEVDFHALSRWPKDPNGMSAGGELSAAIEGLIPFYKEFPEVLVCESNHTVRGHKLAFGAGIPSAFLAHISTVLNAPDGWRWANHWVVDGVRYFHGDAGRSGQYAHLQYLKMFKQNCVIGHIHSYAGVAWEGSHFAVNSGCLIDEDKYAFAYAKNMPIRPNLGCSLIFAGQRATFIPMILDNNGNWIGRL